MRCKYFERECGGAKCPVTDDVAEYCPEQITASCLCGLLDREELEIVELCKSNQKFAYDNLTKITRHLSKRAGCRLNDCVITDMLIRIIAKAV